MKRMLILFFVITLSIIPFIHANVDYYTALNYARSANQADFLNYIRLNHGCISEEFIEWTQGNVAKSQEDCSEGKGCFVAEDENALANMLYAHSVYPCVNATVYGTTSDSSAPQTTHVSAFRQLWDFIKRIFGR